MHVKPCGHGHIFSIGFYSNTCFGYVTSHRPPATGTGVASSALLPADGGSVERV